MGVIHQNGCDRPRAEQIAPVCHEHTLGSADQGFDSISPRHAIGVVLRAQPDRTQLVWGHTMDQVCQPVGVAPEWLPTVDDMEPISSG